MKAECKRILEIAGGILLAALVMLLFFVLWRINWTGSTQEQEKFRNSLEARNELKSVIDSMETDAERLQMETAEPRTLDEILKDGEDHIKQLKEQTDLPKSPATD